MHPRTRK